MYLILILKDVVKDLLDHAQARLEDHVRELWAPENSLLHVFQADVFKPEDFLSVMIGDECTLHASNFTLHNIFQETSSYQIIEFAFI